MPVGPRMAARSLPAADTNCCAPAFDTNASASPFGHERVVGSQACKPEWMSNGVVEKDRNVVETGGRNGKYKWPKPKTWTSIVKPATPGVLRLVAVGTRWPRSSTKIGWKTGLRSG